VTMIAMLHSQHVTRVKQLRLNVANVVVRLTTRQYSMYDIAHLDAV
jgi:hypothetical protein